MINYHKTDRDRRKAGLVYMGALRGNNRAIVLACMLAPHLVNNVERSEVFMTAMRDNKDIDGIRLYSALERTWELCYNSMNGRN